MTRRDRIAMAALPIGVAAMALMPPFTGGQTLCPIALLTGTACPGCGMTRAVSHLLHSDLQSAMTFHPLVIPTVAVIVIGWVWLIASRLGRAKPPSVRLVNVVLVGAGIALIGVWIVRLSMGTLPPV